ncbi:hypothetical protein [Streptomyces sp. NPDC008139]|uniref:hypothetical protein n=1 Tax=Streptomyces sp. NPDC008139 TaxID=3364814 RepID=UPI0036E08AB2
MTRPQPAVVDLAGGPLQVFTDHRGAICTVLGVLGLVIAVLVLTNRSVRRIGGWRVVRRWVRRESRLTANAFTAPLRGWVRYRRQLRLLGRLLDDPGVWRTGERALRAAHAAAPDRCRPYGVLVGDGTDDGLVGVLVAGRDVPEPPPPWVADDRDPRVWWSAYEEWHDLQPAGLAGGLALGDGAGWEQEPVAPPVLIAAVGVEGGRAVFLDLASGAPVTSLDGDERVARPLVHALAAQLDRRLPPGAVTVADGVHPRHAGPPVAQALRDAARWSDTHEGPAFVVCQGPLPDAADLAGAAGPRVLAYGRTHGRARLLDVDRDGLLTVHGTPLRVRATSVPRAVAAAIGSLPPYEPPPLAAPVRAPAPHAHVERAEEPGTVGVSAVSAGGAPSTGSARAVGHAQVTPRQRSGGEAESGPVGVSASAAAGSGSGATPPGGRARTGPAAGQSAGGAGTPDAESVGSGAVTTAPAPRGD